MIAVVLFYDSMAWGFVIYKFWTWFLIPAISMAFPEVVINQISYPIAVGLFLFTIFFRLGDRTVIKEEYKDTKTSGINGVVLPWMILGMGWLIKLVIL
jgi:hypothetical protein